MENKTLKETAQEYVPKRTLIVSDLDKVDLSSKIEDRDSQDKDGKPFYYKVMIVNEIEYRVPATVLEEIKKILKLKPEAKYVKVTSSGSGLNTSYETEYVEEDKELPA